MIIRLFLSMQRSKGKQKVEKSFFWNNYLTSRSNYPICKRFNEQFTRYSRTQISNRCNLAVFGGKKPPFSILFHSTSHSLNMFLTVLSMLPPCSSPIWFMPITPGPDMPAPGRPKLLLPI